MIHHLIVFNTRPDVPEAVCHDMASRAREVLTRIPGVRGVSFGVADAPQPAYRYLLVVEFAHQDVIRSYRDHPLHGTFADHMFRPLAVDPITMDYRMVF
ncbi:MAG: Dabb family protein [Firmicutes bacterium]|nr:Dabb family protein [Bacillota bacterium]